MNPTSFGLRTSCWHEELEAQRLNKARERKESLVTSLLSGDSCKGLGRVAHSQMTPSNSCESYLMTMEVVNLEL